ncbi:MAG: NnrS family protein [Chloroflexi bacterium]|nr:NnrS family protein [Chloroflexota bacterium]
MREAAGRMMTLDVVQPVTTSSRGLRERFPSLPFLWWAIGLALTAGFGLGMLLFLHLAAGQPSGPWWLAAVQAHGHVQLFGWGGMFALGIGLYFLPRLRGCPDPSPSAIGLAAWLLGGGLALRALTQPAVAALEPGGLRVAVGGALALSGVLELTGAALAVGALVVAARRGPPLASRTGLVAVIPFALTFFVSLLLALAVNAVVLATDARSTGLVPGAAEWTIVHLGLVGMLVAISGAVSARTFPLYLRLRVPPRRELHAVFGLFAIGLVLRAATPFDLPPALQSLPSLGAVFLGLALVGLVVVVDVPFRRTLRTRAGQAWPSISEYRASDCLIVAAYSWLGAAGVLMLLEGLAGWGLAPSPPLDAERHALGAGLVTLLILGMAIRMVPGFTGRKLYSARLVWATVWLGNAAALLRVVPLFLPAGRLTMTLLGLAGLLGLVAVACLGWNLWRTVRGPAGAGGDAGAERAPRCARARSRSGGTSRELQE